MLEAEDARLIDYLHADFPLVDRPFEAVGDALGRSEASVIDALQDLLGHQVLTRFGPLFQIERAGGQFVLAAIAAPEAEFQALADRVNAFDEVAHNYRREHPLNMWFVVAAETPAAATAVLARIEQVVGLPVLVLPKEVEYGVELRLPARPVDDVIGEAVFHAPGSSGPAAGPPAGPDAGPSAARVAGPAGRNASPGGSGDPQPPRRPSLEPFDRALIRATQSGLPLVPRPYEAIGATLGLSGEQVRGWLQQMLNVGLIRRIGAVPNHYRLGYTANGMTVWDVNDAQVDDWGRRLARLPGVSHCYRRPRRLPRWRYNLFAMLHGTTRASVERQAGRIAALLGDQVRAHEILYSTAILKKTGLRLAARDD